jgi:polyferredoxin
MGTLLFLGLTGLIIWIYRHDIAGIKFRSFFGLLVFSALLSLGISEIAIYLSMGEDASGTLFSLIYMTGGTVMTAYLWKSGDMSRSVSRCILVLSAITGFVFLAPLMPMEFTGLIHLALGTQTFTPGILGILFVLILAFIAGRTFCAHICPVGSVQELAFEISKKKSSSSHYRTFEIIRAVIFIATVIAGLFFINLMEYTGIYDFFSLVLTGGFFFFAALLVLSTWIYRPVCRVFCPFGVLFSLAGHFSRKGLERTGACIHCKKCEKACPAHCAEESASRRECYLCGRCKEKCPVNGALVYRTR